MELTYMNYLVLHFKILFILAYDATDDNNLGIKNNKKYFLPKAEIKNYNVLIDGRNFYDQP